MGPRYGGPPSAAINQKNKIPKPKHLREVPGFLKELFSSFFSRLFYIFRLVWETRPWILFIMLFTAVFNGVTPVVSAWVSARLLNGVAESFGMGSEALQGVLFWLLLYFSILIVDKVVNNIYYFLYRIGGELVTNHIKEKIMEKARQVDLSSFDKPDFYERLENANREAGMRPVQIMTSTFDIISRLISMVSFIVILWAVTPLAPFAMIAVSIPSAVINFIYRRKNFLYMRHRSKDRRQMNYFSEVMVNKDMVKEVRLFGLSDTLLGKYREVFHNYFRGIKSLMVKEGVWNVALALLSNVVTCVMYVVITIGVCNGTFDVGDYSLFTGALVSISAGVTGLITTTATIYEGTLFIDNLILFMNEEKHIVPTLQQGAAVQRHCGHVIRFDHVSFRYPGTERDVLHDVSFTLDAGETCVLVGLNGAGKTTLIKLITRLYDPTAGTIYLDGRDIREYDVEQLYQMFGIIFQDFGKYAMTVTENVAFGDVERPIDSSEIEDAARQASAHPFITQLPDGYDTPLMRYFEDDGIELSIGQWQKLSVARAFYSDSDVLILDEPTASLDAIAEQEIFSQFDRLRKDKTTIFVSHRLSSATVASKILVLENGRLIEEGTHQELMNLRGKYYELFSAQAKRYITTAQEGMIGADAPEMPKRPDKPEEPRPPHPHGAPRGAGDEVGENAPPHPADPASAPRRQ